MTIRSFLSIASLTSALVFLAACGGGDDAATPAPTPDPVAEATPEPTPEPTPEATPEPEPESAFSAQLTEMLAAVSADDKARTNPKKGDAAAIEAGKEEFGSVCLPCHGPKGAGDGPASRALNPRPSDLTDAARAGKLTDGDRFAIMKNGVPGTAMQAFGAALSDDQIWEILAYVSSLSEGAGAAGE